MLDWINIWKILLKIFPALFNLLKIYKSLTAKLLQSNFNHTLFHCNSTFASFVYTLIKFFVGKFQQMYQSQHQTTVDKNDDKLVSIHFICYTFIILEKEKKEEKVMYRILVSKLMLRQKSFLNFYLQVSSTISVVVHYFQNHCCSKNFLDSPDFWRP